jgi:hypothetical protein
MNLTTVVGTCDAYLAAVPHFITLYNRYFEPDVRKLLIGETADIEQTNFEWVLPGTHQWGERMLAGLKQVQTEYTFFVLEDYYLSQLLTTEYIDYLLKFMDRYKADKLSLTPVPDFACHRYCETINTMHRMREDSDSMTSLQPAIWRTNELTRVMKSEYTPWDFEVVGDSIVKGVKDNYFVAKLDEPIYFNFIRRGGILSPGWEEFFKTNNLETISN